MILRIRAGNPIEKPQRVEIKSPLPDRISSNHVLNLNGLELGYDVNTDKYYVYKSLELGPKEIVVYDVELEDVWTIPTESIEALRQKARALAAMLKGKPDFEDADRLRRAVEQSVDTILASQRQGSIAAGAQPIQHIQTYEKNQELLTQTKKDVVRVENLVIANGGDPGSLVVPEAPPGVASTLTDVVPQEYNTVVWRISVQNTSPTEDRSRIFIRRDLPEEIQIQDIVDPGGLQVGKDPRSGGTYVYRERVQVKAGETVTFEVQIHDKWNVHQPRLKALLVVAKDMQAQVVAAKKFKSVETMLAGLIDELNAVALEKGPEAINEQYVSFYRDQGRRLDEIALKLERVKSLIRPIQGQTRGFAVKAPSPKTTWLIIYLILGFLAMVTVAFMVRWMVRARNDQGGE